MSQTKNGLIATFRKRIEILEKDRVGFKSYIERMRNKIENFEKSYSDLIRVKDYLNFMLTNNHSDKIDPKKIYTYSADEQKIYLINKSLISAESLQKANTEIEETIEYYKNQIIEYARIVQLHIKKLELLETTYYKLLYSIEFLEYGENAIKINNDMGYSYYFIIYLNSLTGYESARERLDPVYFAKDDIEKFIFENSQSL